MATANPGDRFWTSTRGRVVSLLRRSGRTVNELVAALGVTDNAVRTTLATLERDGLVRPGAKRPGVRKPNQAYELTAAAEALFPKPYGLLLQQLFEVLTELLPPRKKDEIVRALALRLAAQYRPAVGADAARERVDQSVAVLGQLGGLAEVEERDGGLGIRSFACPVAAAVTGNREACRMVEAFLTELVGQPVRQQCQMGPPPRCYFAVDARVG
jgi:predicted ArsR family transcriptional regulator